MGQSAKALFQLALISLCIGAIAVWMNELNWGWKIGLPLAATAVAAILIWAKYREDRAPDILADLTGSYFERLGFCFSVLPAVDEGRCIVQIFFQNRYANPCTAKVLLRHCTFLPKHESKKLKTIAVEIEYSGGTCGVMFVPLGVPKKYQGTSQLFDVGADVKFPNRRGTILRFKEGISIGSTNFPSLPGLAETPARCELTMPTNVAESVSEPASYRVEAIWCPEVTFGPLSKGSSDNARDGD